MRPSLRIRILTGIVLMYMVDASLLHHLMLGAHTPAHLRDDPMSLALVFLVAIPTTAATLMLPYGIWLAVTAIADEVKKRYGDDI